MDGEQYAGLRLTIVGPLPPPSGGMANQCKQLVGLLQAEGVQVELVRTNAPYKPAFVGKVPVMRAFARLLPYLLALWRASGRTDVMHVLANSGWSWHLFSAPAIWIARLRGTPVVVNYRGGEAEPFFAAAPRFVHRTLASASALVVPSAFLDGVFRRFGFESRIVPNIINLERFAVPRKTTGAHAPHVVVTRNLEPIYDIPTVLAAFAQVRKRLPEARLTVAGSGPELRNLETMAVNLGIAPSVTFAGRIDNENIPALYASADLMINPSTVDNMPISILEAFASGVPVVSTDVGGVPFIAENGRTALLVPARAPERMAEAMLELLLDQDKARRLAAAASDEVKQYAWPVIREKWLSVYRAAVLAGD
ncbi:glycosyltransferase family 4 protein [Zoogloea sp.]|uniref:glycosyltransferase family 4 protein n=1 Tax=Zoogloea sp. TaxID=49181 RepID=UPI0035B02A03